MAKNRKTQSAAARFGPALKTFLLCSLIAGAGVGYVNQKNQIHLLGDQMRKLEIQRDKQGLHRQLLVRKLTALNSPNELESQVQRMNLDLSPTPPDRIVHLSVVPREAVKGDQILFAEQNMPVPVRR